MKHVTIIIKYSQGVGLGNNGTKFRENFLLTVGPAANADLVIASDHKSCLALLTLD